MRDGKEQDGILTGTGKYLTFYVDGQLFAIPSELVIDIISLQAITYMPRLPPFIKGIINIRGKIVPLVDLRLRFNKAPKAYDAHTCIVVTEVENCGVGYIVDQVDDVAEIDKSQISDTPHMSEGTTDYIAGVVSVDAGIVLLLDIANLMEEKSGAGKPA